MLPVITTADCSRAEATSRNLQSLGSGRERAHVADQELVEPNTRLCTNLHAIVERLLRAKARAQAPTPGMPAPENCSDRVGTRGTARTYDKRAGVGTVVPLGAKGLD